MIEARALVKTFGTARVLDGLSLCVREGEVAAIVGPSGGGKSTLLRCLNGLESFDEGEVQVGDVRLGPGSARGLSLASVLRARRCLGMVFQQFHLFPHLSVLENVMSGPRCVLGMPRALAEAKAQTLLDRVGLGDRGGAYPNELSGGQQQRVAIARALAVGPKAVLFDEPTSALDRQMAAEVLRVIADLAASGQTMVVVTHDLEFARRVASTVHVMSRGRLVESGPPARVLDQARADAFLQWPNSPAIG